MELADIKAAAVTKVATGGYRLDGEGWSLDIAATSKTDATAQAVAWKLGGERAAKVAEVEAALKASDLWAVRHVEDGASLTDARKTYRAALRALIGQAVASDDPASISLPAVPSFP